MSGPYIHCRPPDLFNPRRRRAHIVLDMVRMGHHGMFTEAQVTEALRETGDLVDQDEGLVQSIDQGSPDEVRLAESERFFRFHNKARGVMG